MSRRLLLISLLVGGWLFFGWSVIPPMVQEAYAYDETYSFSVQSEANDEWLLSSDVTDATDYADHEAQNADNANGGLWCWTSTGSPSGSTGPPTGTACIYTETSTSGSGTPAAGSQFFCTLRTAVDAGQYAIYVTFNTCMYGDTTGVAYFEAWDGVDTWDIIDTFNGDSTTTFTNRGPYDLTDYENADFKIRFRTVCGTGNIYQNDFSWDEVRIYGDLKNVSPDAPTLYNTGGSEQLSFNNVKQNTTTPRFRVSATHTATFNRFYIELNTQADFLGTSYTQEFPGTYTSGTQDNVLCNGLTPSFPTDEVTYMFGPRHQQTVAILMEIGLLRPRVVRPGLSPTMIVPKILCGSRPLMSSLMPIHLLIRRPLRVRCSSGLGLLRLQDYWVQSVQEQTVANPVHH